jgi:uracil-DNA glycosylase
MTISAATMLIESHRSWWQLAGLETLVAEAPQNWLAPKADPVPETLRSEPSPVLRQPDAPLAAPPSAPAPIALAPLAMPEDLAAFQAWLAEDAGVPGTRWHPQRILPVGTPGAKLMVVALAPELDDHDAGQLFAGDSGRLLDAMLRAIGLTRSDCYLASCALTRPPGGRIDARDMAALTPLLWHHLRLAAPQKLLIFGTDLAQAILGTDLASVRGNLRDVNQAGVKLSATATQHPMLLLDRPARKAAAWDSLKLLAQG